MADEYVNLVLLLSACPSMIVRSWSRCLQVYSNRGGRHRTHWEVKIIIQLPPAHLMGVTKGET